MVWIHFGQLNVGVSKNSGTPKSSILIGVSIINHPFWGFYPYFWKHPYDGQHALQKPPQHLCWGRAQLNDQVLGSLSAWCCGTRESLRLFQRAELSRTSGKSHIPDFWWAFFGSLLYLPSAKTEPRIRVCQSFYGVHNCISLFGRNTFGLFVWCPLGLVIYWRWWDANRIIPSSPHNRRKRGWCKLSSHMIVIQLFHPLQRKHQTGDVPQ